MSYWVYAAYPNQIAAVHRGECAHYNEGKGQKMSGHTPTTTDWFGPYATREEAFERARQTKLRKVTGCGHCRP